MNTMANIAFHVLADLTPRLRHVLLLSGKNMSEGKEGRAHLTLVVHYYIPHFYLFFVGPFKKMLISVLHRGS